MPDWHRRQNQSIREGATRMWYQKLNRRVQRKEKKRKQFIKESAWRAEDRCGLCSTAFHTASTFSRVLTVCADPPCFFFVAEAMVWKLCTQRSIVFHDRILP
jgi:hypothetical protein